MSFVATPGNGVVGEILLPPPGGLAPGRPTSLARIFICQENVLQVTNFNNTPTAAALKTELSEIQRTAPLTREMIVKTVAVVQKKSPGLTVVWRDDQ